jgi:hypothetical protein
LPDKKSIQLIRLDFHASKESESISAEISAKVAEHFAQAVLQVLRSGNIPPPSTRAPSGARPKLRIVKSYGKKES